MSCKIIPIGSTHKSASLADKNDNSVEPSSERKENTERVRKQCRKYEITQVGGRRLPPEKRELICKWKIANCKSDSP
ncbi:hypothetical protein CS022_10920 [Veronia nyctiphanis]|uniref:Uncharacterized protein n=1 Tax=Veronia nyctiphanis TaxID=1278244 RepID=A0A4Q0YRK2_9GAMM|nr:hypothetical protein CS022_10920 [Veronia nyctiphanis]